jgi:hypothetical protein
MREQHGVGTVTGVDMPQHAQVGSLLSARRKIPKRQGQKT